MSYLKISKNSLFPFKNLLIYVFWVSKKFDLRWGPTFCGASSGSKLFAKGHQQSSKLAASGQKVQSALTLYKKHKAHSPLTQKPFKISVKKKQWHKNIPNIDIKALHSLNTIRWRTHSCDPFINTFFFYLTWRDRHRERVKTKIIILPNKPLLLRTSTSIPPLISP